MVLGLEHDAAIEVAGTRSVIYDAHWTERSEQPLWYYMNHAAHPTVRMRIMGSRLLWVATRDLAAGTELRFKYDDAPSAWDAAERLLDLGPSLPSTVPSLS